MRSVVPDLALPSTCFRLEVLFCFSYILSAVLDLALGSDFRHFLTKNARVRLWFATPTTLLVDLGIMQSRLGLKAKLQLSAEATFRVMYSDEFKAPEQNSDLTSK